MRTWDLVQVELWFVLTATLACDRIVAKPPDGTWRFLATTRTISWLATGQHRKDIESTGSAGRAALSHTAGLRPANVKNAAVSRRYCGKPANEPEKGTDVSTSGPIPGQTRKVN